MLSGKQLRSYLAYAVLGHKTPRTEGKPPTVAKSATVQRTAAPKKKRATPRKGPPRDKRYRQWIATLPSIISGLTPCDACHTGLDGGMGMKASDESCIPMTRAEHQEYHRIGRDAFAVKYALDYARVGGKLRAEYLSLTSPHSA